MSFWSGVAQDNSHKLASKLYQLQREDRRANRSSKVRDILVQYGFEDTWESGPPVEKRAFMERFKSVVWAREQNKIMNALDRGEGQVRFLTHLTDDPSKYKVPDYMTMLNNTNSRIMTRFRLRSHKLAVVTGAWTGTPIQDRVCTTCGMLEDEIPFSMRMSKADILKETLPTELRVQISQRCISNPADAVY